MRILIAEDEPVSRALLDEVLTEWGHTVATAADGTTAWEVLQLPGAPPLVLLDWQMPGMDGIEVCRKLRKLPAAVSPYVIFLTGRQDKASIVAALGAGANDYICKPFDADELHARIDVGVRMVELEERLAERIRDLEESQAHIRRLQGILPICVYCKKVRDDRNAWSQIEAYVMQHSEARFSHGVCPDCLEKVKKEFLADLGVPQQ